MYRKWIRGAFVCLVITALMAVAIPVAASRAPVRRFVNCGPADVQATCQALTGRQLSTLVKHPEVQRMPYRVDLPKAVLVRYADGTEMALAEVTAEAGNPGLLMAFYEGPSIAHVMILETSATSSGGGTVLFRKPDGTLMIEGESGSEGDLKRLWVHPDIYAESADGAGVLSHPPDMGYWPCIARYLAETWNNIPWPIKVICEGSLLLCITSGGFNVLACSAAAICLGAHFGAAHGHCR